MAVVANTDSGRASDKSGPRGGGGTFVIENGGQATLVQPIKPAEQTVVTGKNATDNDGWQTGVSGKGGLDGEGVLLLVGGF